MNKLKILIIVSLIILLIIINFFQKEYFINNKKIKIGFIIPITSNKRNYKNIQDIDFFNILINSLKNKLNKKYIYEFYLGYDNDDNFYIDNKENIIKHFLKLNLINSKIKLLKINNKKGKLGEIWSILANKSYHTCDYIYQLGDDIEFLDDGWEDSFIKKLKENKNIGVVGPNDINNKKLLTQSFVHKTHLDIFGKYYPKEIKNWHIDDWITRVYQPNFSQKILNKKVKNSGGPPRYEVKRSTKELKDCLERDKLILEKFLKKINFNINI